MSLLPGAWVPGMLLVAVAAQGTWLLAASPRTLGKYLIRVSRKKYTGYIFTNSNVETSHQKNIAHITSFHIKKTPLPFDLLTFDGHFLLHKQ